MEIDRRDTVKGEPQRSQVRPKDADAPRVRPELFAKPIARFDEQARPPAASAAAERASGISSDAAPGALGKLLIACAFPSFRFRHSDGLTDLLRMHLVSCAPPTARLYRERNGAGRVYYRVRYELPRRPDGRRRQRSVYVGTDADMAAWARDLLREQLWLEERRKPRVPDYGRAARIKEALRRCRATARIVAKRAGFYFHGNRLRERRR